MSSIRTLQFQIHGLGLLIECAKQSPKQYPERAVRMEKGKLISIAGWFMPDSPPPYRILSPEEWIKFSQGEFTNLADIDRARKDNKTKAQEEILNFSTPEFKAKQELITTQLASGIASQPKENIIDWIKDTFGSGLQNISQSVQDFLEEVNLSISPVVDVLVSPYKQILDNLNNAVQNNTQYQYIKKLVNGVINRYNSALEGLKHLDDQPAIIQQLGKIAATAIPVITTIAAAAVPVVGLELMFPPLAVGGAAKLVVSGFKLIANLNLGNTLLKLDRDARGVTEEDLKKLPAWGKFLAFLREMLIFGGVGAALDLGCKAAQISLRFKPLANKESDKILESIPQRLAARNKNAADKLAKLADDVAVRPIPEAVVKYIDSQVDHREGELLKWMGNTEQAKSLLDAANKNVSRIINSTDIHIRISQQNLSKVIQKEKFANVFEIFEDNLSSEIELGNNRSFAAVPKRRFVTEEKFFGIALEEKGVNRPIYGYLSRGKTYLNKAEGHKISAFGELSVKLKPGVKSRTTIATDDSVILNQLPIKTPPASKFIEPKAVSFVDPLKVNDLGYLTSKLEAIVNCKNIDELMDIAGKDFRALDKIVLDQIEWTKVWGNIKSARSREEIQEIINAIRQMTSKAHYVEAQVHGGVLAEDIEEIFVNKVTKKRLEKKLQAVKDLNAGLEVKEGLSQEFIDMVRWADVMGVKITAAN